MTFPAQEPGRRSYCRCPPGELRSIPPHSFHRSVPRCQRRWFRRTGQNQRRPGPCQGSCSREWSFCSARWPGNCRTRRACFRQWWSRTAQWRWGRRLRSGWRRLIFQQQNTRFRARSLVILFSFMSENPPLYVQIMVIYGNYTIYLIPGQ